MDALPKECVVSIMDCIFNTKHNDMIVNINDHSIYVTLHKIGLDWEDTYNRLNQIEALYQYSTDYIRSIINEYFDMKSISNFKNILLKELIQREKNKRCSFLYYISVKEIPFTHSNQTCIWCDERLPADWITKTEYTEGLCSSKCHNECISNYPSLTVNCKYIKCRKNIRLVDLGYNVSECNNWSHYCDDNCYESEQFLYEDGRIYNDEWY